MDNDHLPVPHEVRVVDIDMPFWSMVGFMIKWAIASIPAMLVFLMVMIAFSLAVSLLFGGIFAGLAGLAGSATSTPTPQPSPTITRPR